MKYRTAVIVFCLILLTGGLAEGQGANTAEAGIPQILAANEINGRQFAKDAAVALDSGLYSLAEADARKSIAADNSWGGLAKEVLASALTAEGKDQEALELYSKLAEEGEPRDALPYALLLLRHGRWAQALAAYENALPNVGSPLFQGSQLLEEEDDFSADTPTPNSLKVDIHIALGFTFDDEPDWAGHSQSGKAITEYRSALRLDAESPLASLAYAEGLREAGQTAAARSAFQDVAVKYKGDIRDSAKESLDDYFTVPTSSGAGGK